MNKEKQLKSMMDDLEKSTWGNHFFLNEDKTYRVCTLMEWSHQLEHMEKHVAQDDIDDFFISTVWLGLNHNWGSGPPLLFETMVFKGSYSEIYCDRYSTWEQAEAGHKKAIEWIKNGCKEDEE